MGRVHSLCYSTANKMFSGKENWQTVPVGVGGTSTEKSGKFAERFGYQYGCEGYKELIEDPSITIFDNVAADKAHIEPCIAAAKAGKHIVCEKPLAIRKEDAFRMKEAVKAAGVKNICCFSYRFMPAIRLAHQLIQKGFLGQVYHFAGTYYQDQGSFLETPIEDIWYIMGSGVDQGICSHLLDMARFLLGDITQVCGMSKTYVKSRNSKAGTVDVNAVEGFHTMLEFQCGASGMMQTLGVANGKQSEFSFEIFGSEGSIKWDMAEPNNLYVYEGNKTGDVITGWRKICVTESNHPFMDIWWPKGHLLGWEHGHTNLLAHFVNCVANDLPVEPYGATFEDAYVVCCILESIHKSSEARAWVPVEY